MIRRAEYEKDLETLHMIIKESYQIEMGNKGLAFRVLPRWPDDINDDVIKNDIKNMYVYEQNNIVMGCMGVGIRNEVALVGPLAVALKYQHHGVGTKLMKFAETLAQTIQVERVSCRTDLITFYDKLGYKQILEDDVTKCVPQKELSRDDLKLVVYQRKLV